MRIALVHDWLTGMRGGEKVLLELCRLYPDARVYTLFWDERSVAPEIEARIAKTSFLQRLRHLTDYRNLLPLFPTAIRSLDIDPADVVISSSHAVAIGARVPAGARHVCYLHTPMRYVWDESGHYFAFGRGRHWKRLALNAIKPYLKRFDRQASTGPGTLVANSHNVRERICRVYGRDAHVVYPPVDTEYFRPDPDARSGGYYLVVSALEGYKRIDLAIEAFRGLDRRLVVVGTGTLRGELERRSPSNVEFAGRVSDAELRRLYQRSRAFLLPGEEDFGIAAVEAQACGRPVICFGKGGGVETVQEGLTGVHFLKPCPPSLVDAILRLEKKDWSANDIRANAEQFSTAAFRANTRQIVSNGEARR